MQRWQVRQRHDLFAGLTFNPFLAVPPAQAALQENNIPYSTFDGRSGLERAKMPEMMRPAAKTARILMMLAVSFFLASCASGTVPTIDVQIDPTPTGLLTPDGLATLVNRSATTIAGIPTATPVPSSTPAFTQTPFPLPNGKLLYEAFQNLNGTNYQVIKMKSTGEEQPVIVIEFGRQVDGQQVNLFHPRMTWAPDGHRFAFLGTDLRADQIIYQYQDIFISSADGKQINRLTYSPQYYKGDLSWSPDGESLLVSMGQNEQQDLFLVSAVTGELLQRLTSSGSVTAGAWAPDGHRIAFAEDRKLFVRDLADDSVQFISDLPDYTVDDISWSPRGDKIALSILGNFVGCGDIFILDLPSGEITDLTPTDYAETSPSWLPDGQHLLFSRAPYRCAESMDGLWNIYLSDLSGQQQLIVPGAGDRASAAWLPVPSLEIGRQYAVAEAGDNLNVRDEPSLAGKVLEKLPAGEVITVLDGFVDADGYYWWQVQTRDGTQGWTVEMAGWYQPFDQ